MLDDFYEEEKMKRKIARYRHIIIWYIAIPAALLVFLYRMWVALN